MSAIRISWLMMMVLGASLGGTLGGCADDQLASGGPNFRPETDQVSTPENTEVDARIFEGTDLSLTEAFAAPHQVVIDGGTLHITPMPDFYGAFTVSYTVDDGVSLPFQGFLEVLVQRADDHFDPRADDLDLTFHGHQQFDLPGHDVSGTNPSSFTYTIVSPPKHGVVSGVGPFQVYTSDRDYLGDDSFSYTASYLGKTSKPATVHLHLIEGSGPAAASFSFGSVEDSDSVISMGFYTSDPDGDALRYSIATPPAHGTVIVGDTTLTYRPSPDYNGPDSFVYTTSDGLHTANGTVTLNVQPINDAPVAFDQTVEATEDVPAAITLTGSDVDGDAVRFQLSSQPLHGALSGSGAIWTYTPVANYNGSDSFTFIAIDPVFASSQLATVTIHVAPVADRPIAPSISVTATEDQTLSIALPGNDPDGTAVTFAIASAPAHGTVTIVGAAAQYVPSVNYNGADAFSYTVSSGGETSDPGTVTISVTAVDDAPVATAAPVTTAEDTSIGITLAATDVDNTAAELTYAVVSSPVHGTLSGTPPNLVYTPTHNYAGGDSFSFRARDLLLSSTATVTITVTPANDPPTPADDYAATDPGQPLTFDVIGNDTDPDGDTVTLDSVDAPAHGSIEIDGNKLIYTPDAGFNGVETFAYTVADPSGATAKATVHMGVGTFPTGAPSETFGAITALGLPLTSGATNLEASISGDGRFVAFTTMAALVAGDTNNTFDVYLYDRGRRELTWVSATHDQKTSQRPHVSGNGRYVVFESSATDLVAGDTNGKGDIFRYDRITGATIRISVATDGTEGNNTSLFARVSDDGDTVAFLSLAFDLVANDVNGAEDAFVRHVTAGTTERVSLTASGGEADLATIALALSGDGHMVAFTSASTNLVAGDSNNRVDVFVRDLVHATTLRASVSSTGLQADDDCFLPSISSDGRFVSFQSSASTLVAGAPPFGTLQVYVRDLTGQTTTRTETGNSQEWSWLSGDGRFVTIFTETLTELRDRFAAHSQSAGVGRLFPTVSSNGRYMVTVSATGGPNGAGSVTVVPNLL